MSVQNAKLRVSAMIRLHEGFVEHMYLDTVSKVTVGYGTMMPDAASSAEIKMINPAEKRPREATDKEKAAEWEVIQALSPAGTAINIQAARYRKHTTLVMQEDEGRRMLLLKLDGFIRMLRLRYPGFDEFPEDAQVAMMDMAYNLGKKIYTVFKMFSRAITKLGGPDWADAARQSNRPQLSKERNKEIFDLFMSAHRQAEAEKAKAATTPRSKVR